MARSIDRQLVIELGLAPAARADGTFNGSAIDRYPDTPPPWGGRCGLLYLVVGATTGTPSSFTATASLQHSADGSTGWATIGSAPAITAVNSKSTSLAINFGSQTLRYLRAQLVLSFVGGTTPTIDSAVSVVLGGRRAHA